MKKILLTVLVLFCICKLASAQRSKGLEFGIGIGYSASTIVSDDNDRVKVKSGFNAAITVDKYFSNQWSVKVKAIYDQKGANSTLIYVGDVAGFTNISSKYISIPVMANWHFSKMRNWYLNFGPYAGFLLDAEKSITYAGVKYSSSMKSQFNAVDAGLAYGIGVKLPVAKRLKLYLEFDGQNGVTNIFSYTTNNSLNARGSFNIGLNF